MSEGSNRIVEVTAAAFDEVVIRAPADVTVVVEFYATWCPKCRTLTPLLERLVPSYGPRALLAMVDVDAQQALGYRFAIQGVPTVKFFRGGRELGEFVGALPEGEVKSRLDALVSAAPAGPLIQAREFLARGHKAAAERLLHEALRADPSDSAAMYELGKLLVDRGETAEARRLLEAIPYSAPEYVPAQAVLARIKLHDWCAEIGEEPRARERLARYDLDLDARFGLGCCLAVQGRYREALDELVKVLQSDRRFRDGAARDAVVAIFLIVGQRSPLAEEYRQRVAQTVH